MKQFILDTNVVSELRRGHRTVENRGLVDWATRVAVEAMFITSVSLLELEIGILRVERRDQRQGAILRGWFNGSVLAAFAGRVLSFDQQAAIHCAGYHVPNPCPDRDSMIAAIAAVRGMTVVTRNTCDFEGLGIALLNPWANE